MKDTVAMHDVCAWSTGASPDKPERNGMVDDEGSG
jgi:hypothetical protein